MTDDGWVFLPEKMDDEKARHSNISPGMDFYYRALAINPKGNNRTDGSSGKFMGSLNSEQRPTYHPFSERGDRAKSTPERDIEKCSIDGDHSGEVGKSFYRDHSGKSHIQVLCEVHRGTHWRLVRDLPPGTLGEWRRAKRRRWA